MRIQRAVRRGAGGIEAGRGNVKGRAFDRNGQSCACHQHEAGARESIDQPARAESAEYRQGELDDGGEPRGRPETVEPRNDAQQPAVRTRWPQRQHKCQYCDAGVGRHVSPPKSHHDADSRKAVWYALRRNNIDFAFPVRAFQPYTPPSAEHQVTPEEIVDRLRSVDVLLPLSREALVTIAEATKVHFYSRGEAILRSGTAGDSMFVLHTGTVSVRLPEDSLTGWHQVAALGPGSVFGEMALLTGEVRTADVVALSDVVALEIGKSSFEAILHNHPELTNAISHQIMQRRAQLESLHVEEQEQEELTLISRIKSYFGM